MNPGEFDENGQWIGTCPKCGTNHRGWPPGTLGAEVDCIRSQIANVGSPAAVALLDRLDAKLVRARDLVLRKHWDGR